jgi:hypothetical protein
MAGPGEVDDGEGPVVEADGDVVAAAAPGDDGQDKAAEFVTGPDLGCRLALKRSGVVSPGRYQGSGRSCAFSLIMASTISALRVPTGQSSLNRTAARARAAVTLARSVLPTQAADPGKCAGV